MANSCSCAFPSSSELAGPAPRLLAGRRRPGLIRLASAAGLRDKPARAWKNGEWRDAEGERASASGAGVADGNRGRRFRRPDHHERACRAAEAEFSLSDTQIGIINGLAFAALNVGLGLMVARIAERRHRVSLVAIGTVLWSIATAACGLAGSAMQLLLARIGVGVGEAVGLPATSSIVSDYFPREKRATAMSILNLMAQSAHFWARPAGRSSPSFTAGAMPFWSPLCRASCSPSFWFC